MGFSQNFSVLLDDGSTPLASYASSGNITSYPIKIARHAGYSMSFVCPGTGSPVGTLTIQACNDVERNFANDLPDNNLTNWFDVEGASATVGATPGNGALITIDHKAPMYRWMRVVYTRTSGSITATVILHVKGDANPFNS